MLWSWVEGMILVVLPSTAMSAASACLAVWSCILASNSAAGWQTWRINHSVAFSDEGACTNQAESYFSRLRRMEVGTHHHIAGPYLRSYAQEAAWREDNRRVDNGSQAMMVAEAAMASNVSRMWKGYWQRG